MSCGSPLPTLADILGAVRPPVLVLSSGAGLGNASVGNVLHKALPVDMRAGHYRIDSLLGRKETARTFERHRLICEKAPYLLHVVHRMPVSYVLKYMVARYSDSAECAELRKIIDQGSVRTILATNHRAALWAAIDKRVNNRKTCIFGFLTDYHFSAGWRYVLWKQIDGCFGPISADNIDRRIRSKYTRLPFPVAAAFTAMASVPGDPDHVLVSGGGWGLGSLFATARDLLDAVPGVFVHVACGDNHQAQHRVERELDPSRSRGYTGLESLASLMKICGSVVTKPGGATIAEAHAAQRTLFLMNGLPVTEECNRSYAMKQLGAKDFSIAVFKDWHLATSRAARSQTHRAVLTMSVPHSLFNPVEGGIVASRPTH